MLLSILPTVAYPISTSAFGFREFKRRAGWYGLSGGRGDRIQQGGYQEAEREEEVLEALRKQLAEYNAGNQAQLDLVLFSYAAEHILRIARILLQPQGHALLVFL